MIRTCQSEGDVTQRMRDCSQILTQLLMKVMGNDSLGETGNAFSSEQWGNMIDLLLTLIEKEESISPSAIGLLTKTCACLIYGPPLGSPIDLSRIIRLTEQVPTGIPQEQPDFTHALALCLATFGRLPLTEQKIKWSWECVIQNALGKPLLSWIQQVIEHRFDSNQQKQVRICQLMLCGLVNQNLVDKGDYLSWTLGLLKRCLWPHSSNSKLSTDPADFVLNTDLLEGRVKIPDADLVFSPCSPDGEIFLIALFEFVKELWASYKLGEDALENVRVHGG